MQLVFWLFLALVAWAALAALGVWAHRRLRRVAPPPVRSELVHEAKERRVRAIHALLARDFPHLRDLPADEQSRAVRFVETAPEVRAIEAEIRALRKVERGGQD